MINILNMLSHSETETNDSSLISPPQFHIAGLLLTIRSVAIAGKTVVLRDFNPVKILELIEKEQVHMIMLVPAMWNFLLQVPNIDSYDLSSVKNCATGASIAPVTLKKAILKYFPNSELSDSFGQTETTATTISVVGEDSIRKPDSVGTPYMMVEYRIVDEDMNDVPIGEVGEIVYRGPTIMKEYYKNPEETAKAFKGGWFHSGDLVRQDDEGFIYVIDRAKDMIISGGENIYPAEIEEVLYTMPEILEVAVFGIPDDEWGESVQAAVVLKPNETLSEEKIISYVQEKLASFKKPRNVHFIEALPRNTTGKVLKFKLREQYSKKQIEN